MGDHTVTLEINQQQAEMLDRLIAEGGLGETPSAVLRSGFLAFCQEHPEVLEASGDE
jgi:hypothetical protein